MVIWDDVKKDCYLKPQDNEVLEQSLDVIIRKLGGKESEHFPVRCLMGDLAMRYSATNVRPSITQLKVSQRVNYISVVASVAAAVLKNGEESGDFSDKEKNHVTLYVALPPMEVESQKADNSFERELIGEYQVEFPRYDGGKTVSFYIDTVVLKEESVMAAVAFLFEVRSGKLSVREENAACRSGYTLSLDIGASTTDITMIQNGRYLEKSCQTYKIGGNTVGEFLKDSIRRVYGFDLDPESTEETIRTGRIKIGAGYDDASSYVDQAKRNLADRISESVQSYFAKAGVAFQTIGHVIISGGGSLQGFYVDEVGHKIVTSESVASMVMERLHKICDKVVVKEYGDEARLANVTGLYITSIIEDAVRSKGAA
jgi:hypothetical protein